MTSRHIGGGHKQKIPPRRFQTPQTRRATRKVIAIEYDPIRSARFALLKYTDEVKAYILAPDGLKVGANGGLRPDLPARTRQRSSRSATIPLGTAIHNVELTPGRGGQMARSAGQQVVLNNREAGYALVKMPSGEIRKINEAAYATIGQVGNIEHMNVSSGKAGRTRWQGKRPHVRGMVMNPVDHPDGRRPGQEQGRWRTPSPDVARGASWRRAFKTRRKHKGTDRNGSSRAATPTRRSLPNLTFYGYDH